MESGYAAGPGISVVIPVFNSEPTLPRLVARLDTVLRGMGVSWEVILVNDGSRDASWPVIRELAERNPCVVGLDLMRNYGQHNALLAGIRVAAYDVVVTMDDDLQHPPEELPRLTEKLSDGWDVVYGVPEAMRHGFWRGLASVVAKLVLQSAMGAEIARSITSFRAFRTGLRTAFARYEGPFVSIDVLLTWATDGFAAVRVRHDERAAGSSNYGLRGLMTHAVNLMTGFSTLPLRVASLVGFAFTILGVGLLAYVLGRYLIEGGSVPGFPFLASVIVIFSGAQMFAIGVIGEYLARMHFRLMDKPTYAVRREVRSRPID